MPHPISLRTCLTGLVGLLGILLLTAPVWGQAGNRNNTPLPHVVVFRSSDPVVVAPPIVVQSPVVVVPAPIVAPPTFPATPTYSVQRPIIDSSVEPAPVTVYWPPVANSSFATPWMPVESNTVSAPVIDYRPLTAYPPTTTYEPVTVLSPVVAVPPPPPAVAVPVGPAVVVRPKVYVQGQPVRNFFRAITP